MATDRIPPAARSSMRWRVLTLGCFVATSACGGPTAPTPPPPPPLPELSIACPARQSWVSLSGQPVTATWSAPVVTGAVDPSTTFCWPVAGTAFPVGISTVLCVVSDAASRSATCSFEVAVVRSPRLQVTKFVAFGDSLTEGKVALNAFPSVLFTLPEAYPGKLQLLLSARYLEQTFSVINEGYGGEMTSEGLARLPGVLTADRPEVLLLQEGANDLLEWLGASVPGIVSSLDQMIKLAQGRNVRVFLANQPFQVAGALRGRGAPFVQDLNRQLVALAQRDGVPLVDVYTPTSLDPAGTIGSDGLHLTEKGYAVMAQAFFDAIRTTLEVQSVR
jgi:acyl-CoA thioesterase-1